jgi:hypothetical protein
MAKKGSMGLLHENKVNLMTASSTLPERGRKAASKPPKSKSKSPEKEEIELTLPDIKPKQIEISKPAKRVNKRKTAIESPRSDDGGAIKS